MSFDSNCVYIECLSPNIRVLIGSVTTSGASTETINTIELPSGNVFGIHSRILGKRVSGAGSIGDSWYYTADTKVKNVSGTIEVLPQKISKFFDSLGPVINYTVNGSAIDIEITGIAGTTIDWVAEHRVLIL